MNVGTVIRHLRLRAGLTLRGLAVQSRIHFAYLSQVERGLVRPSEELIRKLAAVLGTTVENIESLGKAGGLEVPVRHIRQRFSSFERNIHHLLRDRFLKETMSTTPVDQAGWVPMDELARLMPSSALSPIIARWQADGAVEVKEGSIRLVAEHTLWRRDPRIRNFLQTTRYFRRVKAEITLVARVNAVLAPLAQKVSASLVQDDTSIPIIGLTLMWREMLSIPLLVSALDEGRRDRSRPDPAELVALLGVAPRDLLAVVQSSTPWAVALALAPQVPPRDVLERAQATWEALMPQDLALSVEEEKQDVGQHIYDLLRLREAAPLMGEPSLKIISWIWIASTHLERLGVTCQTAEGELQGIIEPLLHMTSSAIVEAPSDPDELFAILVAARERLEGHPAYSLFSLPWGV